MAFKIDESRIREVAQIEAEADCTIGAGGHIPLESVPGLAMVSESADVLTVAETDLLLEINRGIPEQIHERYETLLEKRDDEALSEAEYRELLDLSNQIEGFGVSRIEALVKLAILRQVPLSKLMDDLEIQSPQSNYPFG
jgi:hypothetical protein